MIKKLVEHYLNRKDMVALPRADAISPTAGAAALDRLKKRDILLETIIDVGASDGRWSEWMLPVYPLARYLCIEAQAAHELKLKNFVAHHPNIEYVLAAAGAEEGNIYFDAGDLFGGLASYKPLENDCIVVPVTTIDAQVERRALKPPYLIKLDTHGFEVPILDGAARTLEKAEVLIIEVYNFVSGPPALLFYDMCRHLETKGFRCVDIFDPLFRPRDGSFWQIDMVFLRSTRPELQHTGYL